MGLMVLTALAQLFSFHSRPDSRQRDPEKAESSTAPKVNISSPVPNVTQPVIDVHRPVQIQEPPEIINPDAYRADGRTNYFSDDDNDEEDEPTRDIHRDRRFHRFATWTTTTSARSFTFASVPFRRTFTGATTATVLPWYLKLKSYILPSGVTSSELEHFVPNYRWSPIISGVLIPFAILLEIPGLTERWYIQTLNNKTVQTRPNPVLLDVGMALSIACALIANICLILRFLEHRIKLVTVLCILFLTLHDIINICAVTIFGVEHRNNDGFTYGQAFWMTLCSTIASTITNVGLIYDLARTPDFTNSGSGLTRKQRALVIIEIILLLYVAFGAAINSILLHLSYIDGLYFTVVSIETIGFGDIKPNGTGSRVFICFYIAFGILNIGLFVAMCRETIFEGLELGYRKRVLNMRQRRHEVRRYRRWEKRWRRAVEWRLKKNGQPVWVPNSLIQHDSPRFVGLRGLDGSSQRSWASRMWLALGCGGRAEADFIPFSVIGHPRGKHLNIHALSDAQLESAALEAGVPLSKFIVRHCGPAQSPPSTDAVPTPAIPNGIHSNAIAAHMGAPHTLGGSSAWPSHPQTPTHAQVGRMAAMVTKVAVSFVEKYGTSAEAEPDGGEGPEEIDLQTDSQQTPAQMQASVQSASEKREDVGGETDSGYEQSPLRDKAPEDNEGAVHIEMGDEEAEPEQEQEAEEQEDLDAEHRKVLSLLDIRRFARVPKWVRDLAHGTGRQPTPFSYDRFSENLKKEERRANYAKLTVAWLFFLIFWFVGSGIFCATEGWSYGIAMYFCFVAFTTTGYGDYSPQTPAGRSIFVVWALFGVATLTILVSVIQEAGSSRYKDVLHSRVFEKAVKKYRKKEAKEAAEMPHTPAGLQTAYLNASMNVLYGGANGVPNGRGVTNGNGNGNINGNGDSNTYPSTPVGGAIPSPFEAIAARLGKSQEVAQQELEALPEQIIMHARAFHDYMEYFVGNKYGSIHLQGDTVPSLVPDELKMLLDDITQEEGTSERVKREILQDNEARNVLFALSVERALKRMIQAAEHALTKISERDTLMALHEERQKERAKRASRRSLSRSRSLSVSRSVRSIRSDHSVRSVRSDISDDEPRSGYSTAEEGLSPISPVRATEFAPPKHPTTMHSFDRSVRHDSMSRSHARARSVSLVPVRLGSRQDTHMSVHVAAEQMASEHRTSRQDTPVPETAEIITPE
ncbi:hypothetical protein SCP_1100320 [Sparassis crispa]|uniref:Potassium channel domain-containing protein n=1 Tax=Sparassis crispa TaxID=139825 RepID=A0A401GYW3_9APHY|nr:hypothetical protein SCP_1100320 [Sparassis crispa]GBE87357.1 hypothetical protein SCP_1100320 [Sparassis crispa]